MTTSCVLSSFSPLNYELSRGRSSLWQLSKWVSNWILQVQEPECAWGTPTGKERSGVLQAPFFHLSYLVSLGFYGLPGDTVVKNLPANAGDTGLIPGSGRSLEKEMATHSSILGGKSHGQRSLEGYSPWSHKQLDMTEQLSTYLKLLCHFHWRKDFSFSTQHVGS